MWIIKLDIMAVSARNVFRYLYSIFMFAAFLVIFVFAPLVLLLGSLVFHCPRSFVLRVRIFLHIVYLAFIVIFRVSSSFSCAWSGLPFNVWVFARPSFFVLISLSSCKYLVCFIRISRLPYCFRSVCRLFYLDFVLV